MALGVCWYSHNLCKFTLKMLDVATGGPQTMTAAKPRTGRGCNTTTQVWMTCVFLAAIVHLAHHGVEPGGNISCYSILLFC